MQVPCSGSQPALHRGVLAHQPWHRRVLALHMMMARMLIIMAAMLGSTRTTRRAVPATAPAGRVLCAKFWAPTSSTSPSHSLQVRSVCPLLAIKACSAQAWHSQPECRARPGLHHVHAPSDSPSSAAACAGKHRAFCLLAGLSQIEPNKLPTAQTTLFWPTLTDYKCALLKHALRTCNAISWWPLHCAGALHV